MQNTSSSSAMNVSNEVWALLCSSTNCSDDYGVNGSENDSLWCEAGEHELTIKLFQTCAFCLIFVLGVMGNCLVMATFALYRRQRLRSMTDIFLSHLALADLLLLLTLPLQATDTHLGWIFPELLCKATRVSYAVNTYSGLLLLACISVDRYLVVARAQKIFKRRRLLLAGGRVAAACVWLLAVLLSLPEILYSRVSLLYCGMQVSGAVKMATNGAVIAVFGLSFLTMASCYSLIARVLLRNAQRRGKQRWHRQRTLKLMLALVLLFLTFQLPYTLVLSRKLAGGFCGPLLEYVTCTLAYTRCSLNPVLYALVGVRFRGDVLRLLHACGCCGPDPAPRAFSRSSASPSSPALTALSSGDAAPHTRFQFSGKHK
ncbi:C-C chemokine receptor type 10 isoform X2 [Betta splendens]|uniref:C-C chemokine receptor type 10 isoform X2 n=1 Tax=Betta splendens TaxID=158456 RepID=A0A6P7LAB0_BETSP|nr:C-C chemokine receptor type 10 isoform X2 [Betta splendens]